MKHPLAWKFGIVLVAAGALGYAYLQGQDVADPDHVPPDEPVSNADASGGQTMPDSNDHDAQQKLATATFGSGCFWCAEAIFQHVKGVKRVVSGYSGGHVENPTYEQVCSKKTGHAEVVQITYDPEVVSYKDLLEVFWKTHDPTTLNRQGHDVGPQYRSVIFYHNQQQRELADKYKKRLDEAKAFSAPIVTEIAKFDKFYPAEDYHQDFYQLNPRQGYCTFVIAPKLKKFKAAFADKLKDQK